jgi:integrase
MPLYRQPGSHNWHLTLQIAGTRIRRSTGTADRREAEEFEQREREQLWRIEKLGDRGATPFAEVAARWLLETTKRSAAKDRLILDWFCAQPELKERAIADIDSEAIQVLRQLLADDGLALSTVDRYMACLRAVLRKAAGEWNYLTKAPKVPMYNVEKAEPEWLTRAQFRSLKAQLPPHLKLAAEFAVLTGLRMRAMLGLTWDRVDMRRRRAWVPGMAMKGKQAIGIPLSSEAVKVLRKLKTLHPEGERVFQYEGAPVDDCNTAAFEKARARAGLPDSINWHSLRHTFASWAVQNGVSLHELMQLGGWRTYASVLRYAHLATNHLAAAAEKVAGKSHRPKLRTRGR